MTPTEVSSSWADRSKRDWFNTIFMIFFPVAGITLTAVYFYLEDLTWGMGLLFVFFYLATGMSITGGYHRLFAHKGYEAHPVLQFLYLVFGAAAFENSALKWCTDHRVHHRYVDGDDDPYNINRGLWYAHVGWVCKTGNPRDFSMYQRDLVKNKLVMWQHRNFMSIAMVVGVILPIFLGWMMGSALGGLALGVTLRVFVVQQVTFFINSLCHWWGTQGYTEDNSAKDNAILALFTYGEGYHNYHHLFHNDYRNGIRWYHFDPTKWMIKSLSWVGATDKLRTAPQIQILRARMRMRALRLERSDRPDLSQIVTLRLEPLKIKVEEAYERFGELKARYREEYRQFKKEKCEASRVRIAYMTAELKAAKVEYKMAYAQWRVYTSALLKAT